MNRKRTVTQKLTVSKEVSAQIENAPTNPNIGDDSG